MRGTTSKKKRLRFAVGSALVIAPASLLACGPEAAEAPPPVEPMTNPGVEVIEPVEPVEPVEPIEPSPNVSPFDDEVEPEAEVGEPTSPSTTSTATTTARHRPPVLNVPASPPPLPTANPVPTRSERPR